MRKVIHKIYFPGLSALQYVDLRSPRNLYIIGISLFFPLVLCQWMQNHPGAINTGIAQIDGTLSVLLGTTILVGGVLGCALDNLIPGTKDERGITAWENEMSLHHDDSDKTKYTSTYDFPFGMAALKRLISIKKYTRYLLEELLFEFFVPYSWKWTTYVPFLPTYTPKQILPDPVVLNDGD